MDGSQLHQQWKVFSDDLKLLNGSAPEFDTITTPTSHAELIAETIVRMAIFWVYVRDGDGQFLTFHFPYLCTRECCLWECLLQDCFDFILISFLRTLVLSVIFTFVGIIEDDWRPMCCNGKTLFTVTVAMIEHSHNLLVTSCQIDSFSDRRFWFPNNVSEFLIVGGLRKRFASVQIFERT